MGKIKALLVYSNSVEYSLLEKVLLDCPECEYLILRIPDLSILPNSIGQFAALSMLDISSTQITKLPEGIGNLTALTSLHVRNTQITKLPEGIGNLTALTSLDIGYTYITELPEGIGNLTALTSLHVGNTQITKLPEWLGNLTALTSLDIGYTYITELPEGIGNLTALTSLYVDGTRITELPGQIYSLPLARLSLENLVLKTLPKDILDLNLLFVFEPFKWGINLKNTDILEIGISTFKKPIDEIKLFYDELEREKVILNEARVIFIGDGGAGKSTIIHRLQTDDYEKDLPETRGVLINKWKDEVNPQNPLISFWDFGGQAVMHSMHEFFLGERCLYVLVLDGRRDDRPEYWLDIIRQYGHNSSVMIVMNKIDQNENAHVDELKLRREYENIFHEMYFHRISCEKGTGFDAFKSELLEVIHESESCHKVFPGRWNRIKLKLEDLKDQDGNPISYLQEDIYRGYCEEEGIMDKSPQDTLLRWLNDLGICFSYKGKDPMGTVEELKVLRPEWITNGVYKIINSEEAKTCNGFIPHSTIKYILEHNDDVNPTYKNTEMRFILNMMRDFMLSYQVDHSEFIPMLTADSEPELPPLADAIHLQIVYEAPLPTQVLYHFVTQMKADVDKSLTWRSGTYLKSGYDNCSAIVRFGKTKSIIDIYVAGDNKASYLAHIRRNLEYVQRNMDIEFDEYVGYRVHGKVAMPKLKLLLGLFKRGKQEVYLEEIDEDVKILDVLSPIVPSEVIQNLFDKLRQTEDDLRRIEQYKMNFEEMRNVVFSIDSKTDAILSETQRLTNILERIESYSEEQRKMLQDMFEEISRNNNNPQLEDMLHSILAAVKQGKATAIRDNLIRFISVASGMTSLYPYVEKLLELISKIISC